MVLDDKMVSHRHAEIRREGETAMLYDLNSTNGTLVNGRRISGPFRIRSGDVISLGRAKVAWNTAARGLESGNRGRLSLVRGQSEPSELELSRTAAVSIGRSPDNEIVIKGDALSSRRHAEIRQTLQGHEILDLGSANGVFVNGQKIDQACLQSGDRIRLSSTEFLYND